MALAKVARTSRARSAGLDGSWVAHPGLVPLCQEVFDAALGDRPNQLTGQRNDVSVSAADLLAVSKTPGQITEAGLRNNISVGLQYLTSWLGGNGAVAIFNLMEDAATAEMPRPAADPQQRPAGRRPAGDQGARRADHRRGVRGHPGGGLPAAFDAPRFEQAAALFSAVALADDYAEFLTLPAYEEMP